MKQLLIPLVVLVVGLFGVIEPLLVRYVPTTHLGVIKLRAAVEVPKDHPLVVVTGDSRTVAALGDSEPLAEALSQRGCDVQIADLAMESTNPTWQSITVEEYLARRPDVDAVIMGVNCDRLLDQPEERDSASWAGTLMTNFLWTRPFHFDRLYPGFPRSALDPGLRYHFRRLTNLGIFSSILQSKWTRIRNRIFGIKDTRDRNQFGAIEDMKAFVERLTSGGEQNLRSTRTGDGWRLNPVFVGMMDDLEARKIPLIVVELPMQSNYRSRITHSPLGTAYRLWLGQMFADRGVFYIDLSAPSWATDDNFPDMSHIIPKGARQFQKDLADPLAKILRPIVKTHGPGQAPSRSDAPGKDRPMRRDQG